MTQQASESTPQSKAHQKPKVIAVASGKGGVGKTWFSITLTHWFAKQGRSTLLFDSDLGLANVDIQLGLTPDVDLGTALSNNQSIEKAKMRYEEGNFDIIAGRSGSGALAAIPASRMASMREELKEMSDQYDNTIIDLGAGVERSIRSMAKDADTIIVISNDEPTSLTDAYTFIKVTLAEEPGRDIRIVINAAHSKQEGEKTYQTLLKACRGFLKHEPPLLGIIRRDRRVPESIRAQTPILKRHPNSDAADDVEMIARALLGGESKAAAQ